MWGGGGEGGREGLGIRNWMGDQPRKSCREGSKFLKYSDPLKKLSRKDNHEQLLLPCITFPKPLTKSALHAVLGLNKFVVCLFSDLLA